jgi:hypothetical protein
MKAYSFSNTILLINGVEITGFSDGDDVIDMKRRVDSASDKMGADGNMMVSISVDKSGEIGIKLQQTSSSNRYLTRLHQAQEVAGSRFKPIKILFQDTYRNDMGAGSIGYIKKPADMVRGQNAQTIEWSFVVEHLDLLTGDPLSLGSFLG